MKTTVCDRCGAEVPEPIGVLQTQFSIIKITRMDASMIAPFARDVDLCNACTQDFLKWLDRRDRT